MNDDLALTCQYAPSSNADRVTNFVNRKLCMQPCGSERALFPSCRTPETVKSVAMTDRCWQSPAADPNEDPLFYVDYSLQGLPGTTASSSPISNVVSFCADTTSENRAFSSTE